VSVPYYHCFRFPAAPCLTLCVCVHDSITIGPVAVMSLLTGQIITQVQKLHPKLIAYEIASALAVLCGAFVFVLGILRLGYVVIFCHMSRSTYVYGS
jgi:MFS superfamily sulfate permease-like transporter